VLGRVGQRLGGGADDRAAALVQRQGPDRHQLHRHAEAVLDLGRGRSQRRGQILLALLVPGCGLAGSPAGGRPVEPAAKLTLAAARQPHDLGGVAGPLLDQRQHLQHRVVQVGHDRGALLGAHAGGAFAGHRPHEQEQPRDQDEPDQCQHAGDEEREHGYQDGRVVGGLRAPPGREDGGQQNPEGCQQPHHEDDASQDAAGRGVALELPRGQVRPGADQQRADRSHDDDDARQGRRRGVLGEPEERHEASDAGAAQQHDPAQGCPGSR
jgi:hypothetical protein